MITLTREQHCALAQMDIATFKDLRKRNLLPTSDRTIDLARDRKYTPHATLMLIMAKDLFDVCNLSREAAARTARACLQLPLRWDAIARTSLAISRGEHTDDSIYCGYVEKVPRTLEPEGTPAWYAASRAVHFCETYAGLAKFGPIRRLVCVNASEIAARMRLRAEAANIDLEQFWLEG